MLTLKQSIAEYLSETYSKSKKHGIVGIYISYIPAILVNNPMLIQSIMIKDFSTFPDRPMPLNDEFDPLSGK